MSGQKILEHGNGPLLHGLGKDRVVGECKGLGHNIPGIIPAQHLLVHQQTLEFDNGESGMGILIGKEEYHEDIAVGIIQYKQAIGETYHSAELPPDQKSQTTRASTS